MSTGPRAALIALLTLTTLAIGASGCGAPGETTPAQRPAAVDAVDVPGAPQSSPATPTPTPAESRPVLPSSLPGLGPDTLADVPPEARQAVVVTGEDIDSPRSTVVLYERTEDGWAAGEPWPAHNALRGWTDDHRLGDLRSPIGVYTLSDAGGLLAAPEGTRLPYTHSGAFTISGTGFEGEPLEGSFDHVIAIDYNRVPGTSPLDWTRPLGEEKGGGIWLHVDHEGPTQGCVTVSEEHMAELLRRLDPAKHPIVVMGDAASLAR
ncbi:L,D-transpeptidase family protein [Allostreptomyces psammosilenae]|uniref:L,D-peptidoglycan transpeptidase YkuD (ErfK/YbiS/YcfS/YnhG family) n=1 Tax=Allostreptomyces psammosilenae TaxID=1892865 RepID=A0A853A5W4_9ACTN|nr:L,D-transpeptidase family protein [Allostreptomyces psammosilenae]NYI05872.1 L,D-peptidoglycan transpeptidase YkuD (ErfK/YbiS/YcfS/YnhG family) [Allostreptomyces psammosilenae]